MLEFEKPIKNLEDKIEELRTIGSDGQVNIIEEINVLQKYEGVPQSHIMSEINRYKSQEDPDVLENKMVYGKTTEEKRTYCRELYHRTGAQLGYYYANREKINRGNLLKKMKKSGVVPKKETLQKYNITQEEIDEYIPKK